MVYQAHILWRLQVNKYHNCYNRIGICLFWKIIQNSQSNYAILWFLLRWYVWIVKYPLYLGVTHKLRNLFFVDWFFCRSELSFLAQNHEFSTCPTFSGQKCPFKNRSVLWWTEVSFYFGRWQKCPFQQKFRSGVSFSLNVLLREYSKSSMG